MATKEGCRHYWTGCLPQDMLTYCTLGVALGIPSLPNMMRLCGFPEKLADRQDSKFTLIQRMCMGAGQLCLCLLDAV